MDKGIVIMYKKQFSQLAIGNVFDFQGTRYIKQSSRTARLVCSESLWFYFSKGEWCNLLLDGRFTIKTIGKYPLDVYSVCFCDDLIVAGELSLNDAINKAIAFNENRMEEYK